MNRLSKLVLLSLELCGIILCFTSFVITKLPNDERLGPNASVKTIVKRSVSSGSCYCCLATYDTSCCHACTSHWSAPIPFYSSQKKRNGVNGIGDKKAPIFVAESERPSSYEPKSLSESKSLFFCNCCRSSRSKSCCEICRRRKLLSNRK